MEMFTSILQLLVFLVLTWLVMLQKKDPPSPSHRLFPLLPLLPSHRWHTRLPEGGGDVHFDPSPGSAPEAEELHEPRIPVVLGGKGLEVFGGKSWVFMCFLLP